MEWREPRGSRLRVWRLYGSRMGCIELVGTRLGPRELGGCRLGWSELVTYRLGQREHDDSRPPSLIQLHVVRRGSRIQRKEYIGCRLRRMKLGVFRPRWRDLVGSRL